MPYRNGFVSREPQFVVIPQEFHVVEQCQKLHGMFFKRFYSRLRQMLAGLWQVVLAGGLTWVRLGSINVRIGSKTRVQDAEPT